MATKQQKRVNRSELRYAAGHRLKRLLAILLSPVIALGIVAGVSAPASATDPTPTLLLFEFGVPSVGFLPTISGIASRTVTYYSCSAARATGSTTEPSPACTVISPAPNKTFADEVILESPNISRMTGHVIAKLEVGAYVWWTNSVDLTANSGDSTDPAPATITAPTVSGVIPKRGGAEVSFTPPASPENPAGTTYTVTATGGGKSFTGTGSESPITVAGLEQGITYTFTVTATGPDGTQSSPASGGTEKPLEPGAADPGFFSGSINIPPSIAVAANSITAPSGNIYLISGDVRRILPTGLPDGTFALGTGGVLVPGGITGTVFDVAEVTVGGVTDIYFLVRETTSGEYSIVKTNADGVVDSSYGNSGVFTPNPQPTAPAVPSLATGPKLSITTSGQGFDVGVELMSVAAPAGGYAANFTAVAATDGGSGSSPLAGKGIVVGLDGTTDKDIIIAVITDGPGGTGTIIEPSFNGGQVVRIAHASGTTSVGGVAVDPQGNIYVSVNINGDTKVLGFNADGSVLTTFGSNGEVEIIDGANSLNPGNIEFVNDRLIVSTSRTTPSAQTQIRALLTPAGFLKLPVAGASSLDAPAQTGSGPASFAGPILSGIPGGGLTAAAGATVRIAGSQLGTVSSVRVGGLLAEVVSVTADTLELRLPAGLAAGTYDLVINSSAGQVTITGAIVIRAGTATNVNQGGWTRASVDASGAVTSVRMYLRDPIGVGKVQFKVNGREIAWVRAVDATDPKLRTLSNGLQYLVRNVRLEPGKNALEIFVDGTRIWRAAYTGR